MQDKATALLMNHTIEFSPSSLEAKRVLRKIDLRIMPLVIIIYTIMLMDKNALSFAAIMGIRDDANLTGSQYSWLGSLVYFGYLFGEIPAAFLMQRLPLRQYFGCMSMLWGVVVAMHALCRDFKSLAACRFFLGAIEVCTAPVVIMILGAWYTRDEQIKRVAVWYTSSGMGNFFGAFFAWCIYQANAFRWEALFIFYGCLTLAIGFVLFFTLAASPTDALWLTDKEKAIALERVRINNTGTEIWKFNMAQLKEAFMDIRLYLIFMLLVSSGIPNGGITVFGPTIIAGFGYSTEQTILLSMAPGAAGIVGVGAAWLVAKYTNRTIGGLFPLVLSCIGVVMMFALPVQDYAERYGGYILTLQFPISVLFVVTFMTAGVAGSTKKIAFGAAYQMGYTVGNLIGPQTYRSSDAPNYYTAKYTMLAFIIFTMFLLGGIGLTHWHWNKQRAQQDTIDVQDNTLHNISGIEGFDDVTDFQQKAFKYPL
ncbi:major facilitator superfamily domain-containing protein [Aspergillus novoparasiticus]|uniref:Major facilitator superfamily domain-containing protein n=1 Tax=Aspergillus novoparasiticus TaxID=986946 RepID=A0A5N6EAL9_9EURO|nr:major facilitator superfamily domain-containing protein [Aspergillus novoparasiticus]